MPKPTPPTDTDRVSVHALAVALNRSGRSVRDLPIQRSSDGKMALGDVLKWARSGGTFPVLTDEQHEIALQLAEQLHVEWSNVLPVVIQLARDIGGDFDLALASIMAVVHRDIAGEVADHPDQYQLGPADFRQVVVCEQCGRVRNGRRWVKAEPAPDHNIMKSICPKCC